MAIPWKCFGKNENFWKYVCCRIFVLEQGNSSLSQSVTVYPALPRQPAGDLLATVRRITRDDEDGDGDIIIFFAQKDYILVAIW